ncbi:STAS domain-containing protein [Actinoplanes sp. NPDC051861]|uniref:STAS domain-containing protein n=1 Tax=Actinoplanes sp. NPDC051861 TaxID=3155170 RepID=UPI003444C0C7
MTAVPARRGTGVELTCDGCGVVAAPGGYGLHDTEVVYVTVAGTGWTGTAFARGPHHCPSCSATSVAARALRVRTATGDQVSLEIGPAAAVVRVTGDVDLAVADELRAVLESAAVQRRVIVVDLAEAGTIDSTGVGALVRGRNAARRRGGDLLLAAPSRFLQMMLRTMRLHTAFATYRSVPHALASTTDRRAA